MKKNKKIIAIAITAVIVIIIGILVGISVNKHNMAVKEALSVSESKADFCEELNNQFNAVINEDHKTIDDCKSAIDVLNDIKDQINKSDIKDDERLITLSENINKTITEYNAKIESLTTTVTTTEPTTEETTEEQTTKSNNVTSKSTKSNGPSKSNKNNNNNKSSSNKTTVKSTTKAAITKSQTTTKKSYDPDPAYGAVRYSAPTGNYKVDHWSLIRVYWKWDGTKWNLNNNAGISGGAHHPCNEEDCIRRAVNAAHVPDKDGKNGEICYTKVWVWN